MRDKFGKFIKKHPFIGSEKGWFKKGVPSWTKGLPSELHPQWKGDNVGYDALHDRIEKKYGKSNICEICGTEKSQKYEWSNISGEYKLEKSDWQRLCSKCHQRYDYEHFGKREAFYAR